MMQSIKLVQKPWGSEEWWAQTDKYVGKILHINKGHRLSLQYHNVKTETVRVLKGTLTIVLDNERHILHPGDTIHIAPREIHRMEANIDDVDVVEVSTPEVDDIVRIQDDYMRVEEKK